VRTTFTIVVMLALATARAAAGAPNPPSAQTHVRALTGPTTGLLADAIARSAIVKGLVDDLGETDVVVYLTEGTTRERQAHAYLKFLSAAAGTRYVVVRIDCWRAPPWELIAWLGHELQHAMEIAHAPEVRDSATLAALYRRIGWQWGSDTCGGFESDEAQATGRRISYELAGITRKTGSPIFRGTR